MRIEVTNKKGFVSDLLEAHQLENGSSAQHKCTSVTLLNIVRVLHKFSVCI